jgi:hypothetical protein
VTVGGDGGNDIINVQCKAIQKSHNKSPLYNEYMLMKMGKKDFMSNSWQSVD